jgi:hypothetical protein
MSYGAPIFGVLGRATPLLYGTRELQMGQLTRVIRPFLLIDATMCPRSSPHLRHICSTRSPVAKTGFSTAIGSTVLVSIMLLPVDSSPRLYRVTISRAAAGKNAPNCCAPHGQTGHKSWPREPKRARRQSLAARFALLPVRSDVRSLALIVHLRAQQ